MWLYVNNIYTISHDVHKLRFKLPRRTNRILTEKKKPTDNDQSWYNLYSDGWCEQGGRTANDVNSPQSVILSKKYRNTLYSVMITINGTSTSDFGNTYVITARNITTTSFIIGNYNSGSGSNNYYQWQACGYTSTTTSQYLEIYLN